MGFDHQEAVMVIYVIQAALFVMAYFLRYESDLEILGVVTAFFVISITALQVAAHTGWRLRDCSRGVPDASLQRRVNVSHPAQSLPRLSYLALAVALGAYAALIVVDTASLPRDIRVLVMALLAVIVGILAIMRVAPLSLVEKAALYVTATVLVYLDAIMPPSSRLVVVLSWIAVAIAAAATGIRLLVNDRRFELTPLDVIVLFLALVVPNLPGTLRLPHGGALGIAKLVVVFYAIEMLISRSEDKAVWVRIAAVSILAGLTVRSFVTF
ncbi:MAG: hypothetical protein ACRETD_07120 [Steroidobacteraceae bacterium]